LEISVLDQPLASPTFAVLFSGGLDSSILLAHLLAQGRRVVPLYVDSQLFWQAQELAAARRFLQAIDQPELAELVVLHLPLADLYGEHWSITGSGVPSAADPDEKVYLPGRNPLLIVKAHVWCRLHGVSELALGALRSNPFADATDDFFAEFAAAMDRAVSGSVRIARPLAKWDKGQVMELGRDLPLDLTFSCLAPIADRHCGACNKCGERQAAFRAGGLVDTTGYATPARSLAAPRSR
jgi:7-cyano-7-deazaguanine synthase